MDGALGLDPENIVDILHRWVAGQVMPGVLLVDVAELLHVPNGPGVIAVGHEADFALDHTGGTLGRALSPQDHLGGTTKTVSFRQFSPRRR